MKDSFVNFENVRLDSGSSNRGTSFLSKSSVKAKVISLTPSPHKAHTFKKYPDIDIFDNFLVNCQTETIKLDKNEGKVETTSAFSLETGDTLSGQMPNFVKNYDDLLSICRTNSENSPRKVMSSMSLRTSVTRAASDMGKKQVGNNRNSYSSYSTRDEDVPQDFPNLKKSKELLSEECAGKRTLATKSKTVKSK